MTTAQIIRSSQALTLALALCVTASAQTPTAAPRRPEAQPPKPMRPVQVETTVSAPQVVTILHRLNGLKVIRLLLRGNEQLGALASVDEAFQMAGEVHTNVIAGLALSDGQTIAAWLPEAEAELPPPTPFAAAAPTAPPGPDSSPKGAVAGSPEFPGFSPAEFEQSFASVDVKVVARDGRNLLGRYVGLDGLTGLSVITLSNSNLPKSADAIEDSIEAGQHVRLIGPEPASQIAPGAKGGIYVRVGKTDATVIDVTRNAR